MTTKIKESELSLVTQLVKELCGVSLDASKGYLIEARLGPLFNDFEVSDYAELCTRARSVAERALREQVIDRITTHETLFFRDETLWKALRYKVIPEIFDLTDRTPNRVARVWSAACSTGQEPYSLGILAADVMRQGGKKYRFEVVATDVSEVAVKTASEGFYRDHELIRGSMPDLLKTYTDDVDGGKRISDQVQSMCSFRALDLQRDFSILGTFDMVLCRNVLIYFDGELRRNILERIARRIHPGGRLIVGSSENLIDAQDLFRETEHCGATIYERI